MHVVTFRELLTRSLWAMVRPHRAFHQIRHDERLPYPKLVVAMLAWGAVYAVLHFRAMNGEWLWQDVPGLARCRFLTFFLGAPTAWFLGSIGLWHAAHWLRRPVTLEHADIAAFYVWMVWALMPMVDLVHLAGVPRWTFETALPIKVSFVGHASWCFAFPLLTAELTGFFCGRLRPGRRRLLRAAGLSLAILAATRVVLEPIPQVICRVWQQIIPHQLPGDWWIILILIGVIVSGGGAWRWTLRGATPWKSVALALAGMVFVLIAVQPLRYQ